MRKIAVKRSHTGKNGKKWCNAKKKFSHFLSRQRDSNNLQQDQTPPRDAISVTACLNNYNLSRDFFTSGKTAWKGGSLLLRVPVQPRKKHHTDISKVTFKVYNKHDYNLPLRCLPTSPPTRRTYIPFEMKFP